MNNRVLEIAAIIIAILAMGGCDWVQNRIPADYYDRNASDPSVNGTSQNSGNGGSDNTTGTSQDMNSTVTDGGSGSLPDASTNGDVEMMGDENKIQKEISYEIPPDWNWTDAKKIDATKGIPLKVQIDGPLTKLEFSGLKTGTGAVAKDDVQKRHQQDVSECAVQGQDCPAQPEYAELDVNGVTVYTAMSAIEYAGTVWISYLEFSREGRAVSFTLYGRADQQADLLEKIVSTVSF